MHTFNETNIPGSSDGGLNGRFSASVLFIDISGFTPLTETLFQYHHQGAEILSALLGDVFGEMVCQVYARQGFIPMFAGDGFFAVFPGTPAETAERAWQTAVSIQKHFGSARGSFSIYVTPYGNFEVGVKIGMAVGDVEWGILYNDHQAICYFRGEAFYDCADAEQTAVTGEMIAHNSLLAHLSSKHEAWSADVPTFHKIVPLSAIPPALDKMPPPPLALPPQLAAVLRNQASTEPILPDFRLLCPVFVSFQAGHSEWPTLVHKVMTLAAQYGGTFTRLEFGDKGDMMLLWFGAPVSNENNVERAAKFLLALERETAVPWRAGFTYGLVWAGNRGGKAYSEYGCVGDALNTAARIVSQAQWGQIWLDESVARELHVSYTLKALGEFKFKGKQKAQPLFQLTGAMSHNDSVPVRGFVGREQELAHCRDALAPIFNGRFAGLTTIQGEAGMGKSHLSAALQQQLAEQVTWLNCPADDILRESLNPFQTMLSARFNQSQERDTSENWKQFITGFQTLTTKLSAVTDERVPVIYAELHRTQTILADLAGISLGTRAELLNPALRFTNNLLALTAYLKAQALVKPVVLHLEDAHWLDEESWQFLMDLPRHLAGFPIALLLTGRPDGPFAKPLSPETAVFYTRIFLQPFTKVEIQGLAQLVLGKPVTDDLLALLKLQSQGNPFFAEQLILEMRQQGLFALNQTGKTAVFTLASVEQHVLPQTLNALLTTRLDRLSAPVKTVVQTAAVLGQRFTLPLLAAMGAEDGELLDKIQEAAEHQIWYAQTESHIQFQHALLRDVAYTMQTQAQRRKIHQRAALALEKLYAHDLSGSYREISHHYHAAYENGMLSARRTARRYLRLAGEQAARMYENETAVSYFSTALALSISEMKKFPLLLAREAVYHLQGQRELQSQDIDLMTKISQKQQNKEMMATVALRKAWYAEALGDYAQSIINAQAALAYAHTKSQAAEACLQWGLVLVAKGDYQEASKQLLESLSLANQAGNRSLQSQTLINLGRIAVRQDDYLTAIQHYHDTLAVCQELSDKQMEGAVLNDLGTVAMHQNDFETAVIHYTAALTIAQEIGDRRTESRALNHLGSSAGARFQFVEARENFSRDLQICREIGDFDGEGQALGNLGYVAVILGDYAQAKTYIQQDLQIAQQIGNRHSELRSLALLGWCENAQGNWIDATAHFERGQQLATQIGNQEMEMYCLAGLGNAFVGANHPEAGVPLLCQAADGYHALQMEAFALEAVAGWIRAQLALGNQAETQSALEELLDYLHTVGPFHGANSPIQILWTMYEALIANDDDRALAVLVQTVAVLETAVSHIPDAPTRQSFLENVSWHREIMLASSERMFYN